MLLQGAGLVNVACRRSPVLFTDPQSLSFGYLDVNAGAASRAISVHGLGRRGRGRRLERGGPAAGDVERSERDSGAVHALERRHRRRPDGRERCRGRAPGRQLRLRPASSRRRRQAHPVRVLGHPAAADREPALSRCARGRPATPAPATTAPACTAGRRCRSAILSIFGVDPSVNDDGREKVYTLDIARQAVNAGVVVERPALRLDARDHRAPELERTDPPVVPELARRERRAGVLGDPGQLERPDAGLPPQRRSRGRRLPPARAVLRLRGLGPRLLHRPLARRPLPAALLGQRRQAAEHRR